MTSTNLADMQANVQGLAVMRLWLEERESSRFVEGNVCKGLLEIFLPDLTELMYSICTGSPPQTDQNGF